METTYRVILSGIKPGLDPNEAKDKLAALFKTSREKIDAIFLLPQFVIKKRLPIQTAAKYHSAIEDAGGVCVIEPEPELELELTPVIAKPVAPVARLAQQSPQPISPSEITPPDNSEQPSINSDQHCKRCGSRNAANAVFCQSCGHKISEAAPATPQIQTPAPTATANQSAQAKPEQFVSSKVLANMTSETNSKTKWSIGKVLTYGVIALVVLGWIFGSNTKNLSGHSLRAIVEDKEMSNWILSGYNQSITNLKASKSDSSITISFDMDTSKATSMFGRPSAPFGDQLARIGMNPKLLIRLFDKSGEHLTHFSSAEEFTLSPQWTQTFGRSYRYINQGGTLILLKEKENSFAYMVNQRDLRDTEVVAISFLDFKP